MRMWVVGQRSRARYNFSLLEVIVVLVLLSTVLALVVPRVGGMSWGLQRSSAIKTINSAFHMAASAATATGKSSKLVFDMDKGNLVVEMSGSKKSENSDFDFGDAPRESIFKEVKEFPLPKGTTLDPHSNYLDVDQKGEYRFFPNGEASGSKLSFLIGGSYLLLVDIDRLTGKPLFFDYEN